jgi:hypothetical protein
MSEELHFGPKEQLRREGLHRRAALVGAGCSTYRLGIDHRNEPRSIICLCCGVTSYNSGDIVNLYCAICAAYHSDWILKP